MVLCRVLYPLSFVSLVFSVAMQAAPSVFVTAPVEISGGYMYLYMYVNTVGTQLTAQVGVSLALRL